MKKIAVIGSLNLDLVAKVNHVPTVGETISAEYGGRFQGGKGANQAAAIAKLGGNAVMLGSVGADAAGDYLLAGLKQSGVNNEYIQISDTQPTGQAWITINKQGDNAIVVIPGANNCTDIKYMESVLSVIESADIILLQLEIPLETVCYAASLAKKLGKIVILDPAPAVKDFPDALLKNTDYIKPNKNELELITGCSANDYKAGALELLKRGVKNVIVSLGEKGVFSYSNNGNTIEQPARKVNVVDTTAAGDGFIAAFALCIAKGKSMEESISYAQTVASIVVTRLGAQASIPCADEIDCSSC